MGLRLFLVALCLALPCTVKAQDGCARLSWESCEWNEFGCYQGPGQYNLVFSLHGLSKPSTGLDTILRIQNNYCDSEPLADAWRFDDAGCQTGSHLALSTQGLGESCPGIAGAHPTAVSSVILDPSGDLNVRLSLLFEGTAPPQSYTAWVVTFDFTEASVGPTPGDHSTCGGIDKGQVLDLDYADLFYPDNTFASLPSCDNDHVYVQAQPHPFAVWNGGWYVCGPNQGPARASFATGCAPVASLPSTWGKLKSLYR